MARFFNLFKRSTTAPRVIQAGDVPAIASSAPVATDSARVALSISTVYRCVELLSKSVATLPLIHEVSRERGAYMACDDALTHLLSVEPNEWTSAFDFWRMAVQVQLLHGCAYIVPQYYATGELKRLVLARPGTTAPATVLGRYLCTDDDQGINGEYDEHQIIRLKGATLDGVHCLSVISFAARTTSLAATSDVNTLNSYANGGTTLGILTNPDGVPGYGEMQTEALQGAADRVSAAIRRNDRLAAVGGKWQYIPLGMTAADMQALETRKFTSREICRFFGVHPSFVFDDTSNNYKSAEMANVAFLSNTLNPILRQIENEIERKILPHVPTGGRVSFRRSDLYATDLAGRMAYIEKRIATGTMTINEARTAEGMPPVKNGDTVFMSANLKSINEYNASTENGPQTENAAQADPV